MAFPFKHASFLTLLSLLHSSFHHIYFEPRFQYFVLISLLFDKEHSSIDSLMASTKSVIPPYGAVPYVLFALFSEAANFSFYTFREAHLGRMFDVWCWSLFINYS
jgi:hypothetical protein